MVGIDGAIPRWQVPDVAIRSQNLEIRPKVSVDGCRFGRRFYDQQFNDPILKF
jgi:hypothetical protein